MTNSIPKQTVNFTAQQKKFLDKILNPDGKVDTKERNAFLILADQNHDGKVSKKEQEGLFNFMMGKSSNPIALIANPELAIEKLQSIYQKLNTQA